MTISEQEIYAMNYEIFIRRAWKCERGKHGADADFFKIFARTEPSYKGSIPPSFSKQLNNIQISFGKAVERFVTKFKFTDEEKAKLSELKQRIELTQSAEMIGQISSEGIEITQKYKDFTK